MVTICDLTAADSTWLQRQGIETQWQQPSGQEIYDAVGQRYKMKQGQHQAPLLVSDTVRFSGEFQSLDLNERRAELRRRVTPSKTAKIRVLGITPNAPDTSKTPATYSWWIDNELKRITIKSSNSNDSDLVTVFMLVQ